MKKSILFYSLLWCLVLGLAFVNTYAQQESVGYSLKSNIENPDAECTGAGELIYDDGTFENGYGWNPAVVTEGRSVMLFTPTAYPWQFNTVCFAFTQNQTSTLDFDVVIYDDDGTGGEPGTEIAAVTGLTATGIPGWPTLAWYDFDISSVPALTAGSWYIGIRWNNVPAYPGTFVGADESGSTPLQPGYGWNDNSGVWQAYQISFPDYRALGIRTLGSSGPPCPVDPPTNPDPPNGATDVSINLAQISWDNGAGTTQNEVYFGEAGSMVLVSSGSLLTSWPVPGPLSYDTDYQWKVVCQNDTCGTSGPTWSFTTVQDPLLEIDTICVYPQSLDYWTGTCDVSTKTELSLVNANGDDFAGWMVFDVSPIVNDPTTVIVSIDFNAYLYNNNWPYWAVTPMGAVNPVIGTASEIYNQASSNYAQGIAYSYNAESGTLTNGWIQRPLDEGNATADMLNSLGQGWFAIGIYDWDIGLTYFVNFEGWAEANVPYLCVVYEWIIPVELTSFTAAVSGNDVTLNWVTASEINNLGFEIQRSSNGEFVTVGFVEGHGTTTKVQNYTYTDREIPEGSYGYRLKQVDLDGTFEYSDVVEVEVDVTVPDVFTLEQNYPNPFNPSTQIDFSLAVDSKVKLTVYDILGQEVVSLISSDIVAGLHKIDFDASNLNSGVYFYRLDAQGIDGSAFTLTRKMVLTK